MREVILIGVPLLVLLIGLVGGTYRLAQYNFAKAKLKVIPLYKKPEFKLYEVGALIDGKIHDRDFVATLVHVALHPEQARDGIEEELFQKYANSQALNNLITQINKSEHKNLEGNYQKLQYQNRVNQKLVEQEYYYYNPSKVRWTGIALAVFALFVDYAFIGQSEQVSDWQIVSLSVFGGMALMAYMFHQRFSKMIEARSMLLGYKMFLKTTEFYRVEKDLQAKEQHLPMLLALGVHQNAWKDILEYTRDKLRSRETN